MKKLLIILLLLSLNLCAAQDWFISIGVDPKMAIYGPDRNNQDEKPSLDIEFSFGFEMDNNFRVTHSYKRHEAIGFQKWTYIGVDYRFQLISNFSLYAGLELSGITRHHPDFNHKNPDNYREYTTNPFQPGVTL